MELNLGSLSNNRVVWYDQDFEVPSSYYENTSIIALRDMHVKGSIRIDSLAMLNVDLTVSGIMVLPDSVTTEPIDYPFTSKIVEEYDLNDEKFLEYYQKKQNILDIMKILWENIVMEVPMRFTAIKDAHLFGDGWSLNREENKNDNIDPRLAKLTDLLDRKE